MEELLTVEELAKVWKVHAKSIYRWIAEGRLKCSRIGRKVRFTEEQAKKLPSPKKSS